MNTKIFLYITLFFFVSCFVFADTIFNTYPLADVGTNNVYAGDGAYYGAIKFTYKNSTYTTYEITSVTISMCSTGSSGTYIQGAILGTDAGNKPNVTTYQSNTTTITLGACSNATYNNVTVRFATPTTLYNNTEYWYVITGDYITTNPRMVRAQLNTWNDILGYYTTTGGVVFVSDLDEGVIINASIGNISSAKTYLVNTTQTPSDLNISNTDTLIINASINDTGTASGSATLNFRTYTQLSNCSIYYQNVCVRNTSFYSVAMNKINDSYFTLNMSDEYYMPAYYPFNQTTIQNTVHQNYSLHNNNGIVFNITNMSTSAIDYVVNIELDIQNSTSSSGALLIHYCNSSYTTGLPSSSSNCQLIDSFVALNNNPRYKNNSRTYEVPFRILIGKSQQSYITLHTLAGSTNAWYVKYINASTYNNASFRTANANFGTLSSTSYIFDMHIHPFANNDYIQYNVTYNDNALGVNTSSITVDYFNFTIYPPSAINFDLPLCDEVFILDPSGSTDTNIQTAWTQATSVYNATINYVLWKIDTASCGLLPEYPFNATCENNDYIDTTTVYDTTSPLDVSFNINTDSAGNKTFIMQTYITVDAVSYSDFGHQSCTFNLCAPNWVQASQPCVSQFRFTYYEDGNSCNTALYIPSDNNTYTNCTLAPSETVVTFNFDRVLLFILILVGLIIVSFRFAMQNKALEPLFALTGVFIITLCVIAFDYMITNPDISGTTASVMNVFFGVIIIGGLAFIYTGILALINNIRGN